MIETVEQRPDELLSDGQLRHRLRLTMRPRRGEDKGISLHAACRDLGFSYKHVYRRLEKLGWLAEVRSFQFEAVQ